MAIRVTKISQVSPATDSVSSLVLPLTLFDLNWLNLRQIKRVIFYKLSESSSLETFYSVILPKLEKSLSVVLRHYLPFAGHLKWDPQDPKPCIVVLPHDTVSLTVAETDADFFSVSSKGLRPAREIRPLVPELPVSGALLSLLVTYFPNQGFSIGTASNHAFADAKTAQLFFKSWAYICKHGTTIALPKDLTPSLDRTIVAVPNGMELETKMLRFHGYSPDSARTLKLPSLTEDVDADIFRVTLELTVENVEKLKKRAKNESSGSSHHDELHLSTFVVVYAYIWSCLVKARGGDVDRQVAFGYPVDMRNRLDPPIPETYLGNCVFPIRCSGYKAKQFLGGDGFVKAVEIISDSIKSLGTQGIEVLMDLFVDRMKDIEGGTEVWGVIGSNRDQIYSLDFGWGKPVSCEIVSTDQSNYLSMSSGRSDAKGGVEIGLCLKKSEMDVFISLFDKGLKD